LGESAKFEKKKRLLVSSHLSICSHVEQLVSHWTDYDEILHLSIFRKSGEEIQVSLKYCYKSGYFTWRPM